MKKLAFVALWVALGTQTLWIGLRILQEHAKLGSILYPAVVTMGFILLASTHGRYRWIPALLRIFVGFALLSSVGDRFGSISKSMRKGHPNQEEYISF